MPRSHSSEAAQVPLQTRRLEGAGTLEGCGASLGLSHVTSQWLLQLRPSSLRRQRREEGMASLRKATFPRNFQQTSAHVSDTQLRGGSECDVCCLGTLRCENRRK